MSLIMFDSVDLNAIPSNAEAVGAYVDGMFTTIIEARARFPRARILSIAVFPEDDADCLDVETGDATPAQAPGWVRRQQHRGMYRPAVYANASTMPAVLHELARAGVHRAEVRLWSAHYTFVAHICGPSSCAYPGVPDCDGTQFNDIALGRSLDESLLLSTFFDGPPKPPPPHRGQDPAVLMSGDDDMMYLPNGAGTTVALNVPSGMSELCAAPDGPASLKYMLGDSGTWVPWPVDYNRCPNPVRVPTGTKAVKVQRTDDGKNLVTVGFA